MRATGAGWLGRQDSNLRSRDQNPMPYRLATPHFIPAGRNIGRRHYAGKRLEKVIYSPAPTRLLPSPIDRRRKEERP